MSESSLNNPAESNRCIKNYARDDESTLLDGLFGRHHYVYRSDLIGDNSANATDIHVKTDVLTNSVISSGSAETAFTVNGSNYAVHDDLGGRAITRGTGKDSQPVAPDSEEYLEVSNIYQTIHEDFDLAEKCRK
ncbi:MAG: hypothetical protein U0105_27785 [Candidatus Obscuribacterales bacterium]|jgi:hypothetical protein